MQGLRFDIDVTFIVKTSDFIEVYQFYRVLEFDLSFYEFLTP